MYLFGILRKYWAFTRLVKVLSSSRHPALRFRLTRVHGWAMDAFRSRRSSLPVAASRFRPLPSSRLPPLRDLLCQCVESRPPGLPRSAHGSHSGRGTTTRWALLCLGRARRTRTALAIDSATTTRRHSQRRLRFTYCGVVRDATRNVKHDSGGPMCLTAASSVVTYCTYVLVHAPIRVSRRWRPSLKCQHASRSTESLQVPSGMSHTTVHHSSCASLRAIH
ncbi:hypothetical protein L226DRAFT_255468 [Lentinus tigrinus ALCF2SS1-7]|uniref:uncharacterized protein n=1 Tax=Lentinus tigrinus ALCF2SS1-7 TaxID=1328758 RepID=UPI0011662ACA|nr:hypothetical protein L226DRAFT_255468 [Lentinus tigrinus ALCF2SS1-7]